MSRHPNPWTTLSRQVRYENPWIRVVHHEVLNPAGQPGIYGVIEFRNRAVGVIPVDAEGFTWLVGQFRYPLNRYSWEIPEGGAPNGTLLGDTARRELQEETGLLAGELMELLPIDLSNSVSDESGAVFLAWGLTAGAAEPEETEELALRRVPLSQALDEVMAGRITDSMSVAGLMKLKLLADAGALPATALDCVQRGFAIRPAA